MIAVQLLLLIGLVSIKNSDGFPMNSLENPKLAPVKVLNFLKTFGYVEEDDGNSEALYTEEGISETLKIVQRYGAIEETGILDNATIKLMTSPRCGVPDIIKHRRSKRYVFGSEGWNKRTITYYIANWSPKLGEYTVAKNIQLALDAWGKYGRLTFRRCQSQDADIIVAFGTGYHGDSFPFDGPGNVLAHAFFPYESTSLGGDIHFDADEDWTDLNEGGKEDGTDFSTVALHELGHSLGLAHSTVEDSIMFPYYKGYNRNTVFQLGYDDILGMYQLYIRRNFNDSTTESNDVIPPSSTTETPQTTPLPSYPTTQSTEPIEPTEPTAYSPVYTTTSRWVYEGDDESVDDHKNHDDKHNVPSTNSPSLPDICSGHFDAVATLRGELFIFKDQYVWRLREMGRIEPGYPLSVYQMFPDLPKAIKMIDAAYERPDGMIVLFTGDRFWVYDGKSFVENSPKPLSYYGLPPYIDKIDAVQVWARNGKTYIYKHDRFWRYNETSKQMDEGYPKHMERWRGVPQDLDAATTWREITYFFRHDLFWKFDNEWVIVTEQSPLPAPQLWLGCPEDAQNMYYQRYGQQQ